MVFQNDILAGAAGAGTGYTIATGDRQKWTFSTWIKRGNLSSNQRLFHDSGNTNFIMFGYSSNNEFRVYLGADIRTTALFRDPSAWYHLVVAVDTTQATSSDRVKIYQNGVQITSFSTAGYPSLNYNTIFNNSGTTYQISGQSVAEYFDGYISEFHWIDGQALAPTDFGEYNDDGVWVPKAYAGTYGTNGFYITGEDSADLGADYSGNANDFTSSGLTSDDQRGDTPTANHATWNPLFFRRTGSYKPTFADGNLYVAGQSSQVSHTGTTISSSGKHYAEFLVNNGSSSITGPGVVRSYWDNGLAQSYASNYGGSYYGDNGTRYYNSTSDSQTAPGANRVGIEVDFANNEVERQPTALILTARVFLARPCTTTPLAISLHILRRLIGGVRPIRDTKPCPPPTCPDLQSLTARRIFRPPPTPGQVTQLRLISQVTQNSSQILSGSNDAMRQHSITCLMPFAA
jgi:hypothetical protein